MRIAVTGVAGFVGRYLAAALAAEGHEVVGFGLAGTPEQRRDLADLHGLAAWDHCDVTQWSHVQRVVDRWRPGAIVHLAAQSSAARSFADPAGTFAVNATGTLHLLEAVRDAAARGASVPRVLLVGTSEVYGQPAAPEPVREDAPLAPRTPYGASKAAADVLGAQYARAYGLPVIRTRSFAHTGPGQTTTFALPSFAEQIARAERNGVPSTVAVGNLDVVRDYLDVRDVVRAYVALLATGEPGEAYNVCSGRETRLGDLLDSLVRRAAVPMTVSQAASRLRPTDVTYLVGDPAKLHAATGWTPERSLDRCLDDMLEEWRAAVRRAPDPTKG